MKLSKRAISIIIATGLIVVLIYRINKNKNTDYQSFVVERRNITETIELSGEIDAHQRANLHFASGGLVTYLPFKEGDQVKKFQTIASLDQRALKKTLEKQLNNFAKERNDFDATQDDNQTSSDLGNISTNLRRILEAAQYDLTNATIDVELQDLSIQLSRLYSPFDGILIESPISSANINISALDIFIVVDPLSLYFQADLDESDLSSLQETMSVIIELDAYPELEIQSTIEYISFDAKEKSTGTTYEIDLTLPADILGQLRLGLNGTASIIISQKTDILVLPIETIVEEINRTYVLVRDNGSVKEIDITTGSSDNNYIEITSGLNQGDEVVLEN